MREFLNGLLKKLALYQWSYVIDVGLVLLAISVGSFRPLIKVHPERDRTDSFFSFERRFFCDIDLEYSTWGLIWALMLAVLFAHIHGKFVGIRDVLRRLADIQSEQVQQLAAFSQGWYMKVGVLLYAPCLIACWLKFFLNVWKFLDVFLADKVDQTTNFWDQFFMFTFFFVIQMLVITHGMYLVGADFITAHEVRGALGKKYWELKTLMQLQEIRKYFY